MPTQHLFLTFWIYIFNDFQRNQFYNKNCINNHYFKKIVLVIFDIFAPLSSSFGWMVRLAMMKLKIIVTVKLKLVVRSVFRFNDCGGEMNYNEKIK